MGRGSRKPRQKLDPKKIEASKMPKKKKEKDDWSFDEIARSKPHKR